MQSYLTRVQWQYKVRKHIYTVGRMKQTRKIFAMLWPYMLDPSERLIGVLFALLVALFSPATRSSPLEIAMTCWNLKLSFVKNVPSPAQSLHNNVLGSFQK
jgi:hypothetical protein